ncbi:uncharacterized protein LOC124917880 [Impatiens glandulifera]|uniref:uncharacterized protein LOC124917880 n=1 Tax=Impatiens glandulifera TaxID=253017 RepID=UPI001FB0C8B3|nr:uncharacterized protein LOC124917880 [Impatiens glandulifera]
MVSEQENFEDQEVEDKEEAFNNSSSSSTDYSQTGDIEETANDSSSSSTDYSLTDQMAGKKRYDDDPLMIQNYNLGIRLALEAKSKLGFIDGTLVVPKDAEDFDRWKKMDCLVRFWILNTISDKIKANYSSTTTAKDLWIDIKERYQESNGPQSFQIQRAISNLRQGTLSLEKYFSKLKKLWDELLVLEPLPSCDCDPKTICCCRMTKLVIQLDTANKLTQFLMGLNEYYDNARQQILLMDPKPSINRAYAMLQSIERQREVQSLINDHSENFAMTMKDNSEQQKWENVARNTRSRGGNNKTYKASR